MQETSGVEKATTTGSSDYESLRRDQILDLLAAVPESVRHVKWPVERIREERQRSLRSLISVAKEKSEWHRKRLENIDADTVTEADLAKIPVMTKKDLMSNFDQIVTDKRLTLARVNDHVSSLKEDKYLLDNYHVIASGGSSGFRGAFVFNWNEWITAGLAYRPIFLSKSPFLWRLLSFRPVGSRIMDSMVKKKQGRKPNDKARLAAVVADIASHYSNAMGNSLFYPFADAGFPASLSIREIVDGLNSVQPDALVLYPSILYQLVLEARAGRLKIAPKTIGSTAEPLHQFVRDAVKDTWGVSVTNTWGVSEAGIAAWGCGKGDGMHLNEDLHIIEFVDTTGAPVPSGATSSKIYLTNLYNHTLPIIRYEVDDQVKLMAEKSCPCGSTFRKVDNVLGRLTDIFTYDNGATVHPLVFASTFQHFPHVVEYQVRQTKSGVAIGLLADGPVQLDEVKRELVEYLEEDGLSSAEVSLTIVDRLERTPGVAKLKRYIPLVK